MIIPVYYGSGGAMTEKEFLAVVITLSLICVLIYIIRSAVWLLKKDKIDDSFVRYVFWSDLDYFTPDITTICIAGIWLLYAIGKFTTLILNYL